MEKPEPRFHKRLAIEIPAEAELYEKLKAYQWNASTEIDWSRPIRNFSEESYQRMADPSVGKTSTVSVQSVAPSHSPSCFSVSRPHWRFARNC